MSSSANAFSFGGVSQFGGIGPGSALGSNSSMFGGSAPSNDPYANIDIDLSKVKQATKPGKTFEQKSEEEK